METWIEPEVVKALARIGCQRGLTVQALVGLAVREFLSSMDEEAQCACANVCERHLFAPGLAVGSQPGGAGSLILGSRSLES